MKPAFLAITIAIMTAGFSYAADTQSTQIHQRQRKSYSLKSNAYFMGRNSNNLNNMIDGALKLNLTDEQKSEVTALGQKYYKQMYSDETEVRRMRIAIPKLLNDPSFDPANVKKEIGKANSLEKKISDDYVDALTSLRTIIGKDNYAKVTKALYKYRDDLVQFRKNKRPPVRPESFNKSAPVKTDPPAAAAEEKN